jgi:cytochrome c biogenesis protein CcmG, thiol:disulfide interchange protein DsbE
VAGGALAVLVVVAVVVASRPNQQATSVASPLLGHAAPALSGRDLAGGRASLSSYRGRWVYVNFFASWCTACGEEEPNLVDFAFQQGRRATGAALLSVVSDDSPGTAATFVSQWGARWPAVLDSNGTIANAYGVGALPVTFLIDPEGTVAGAFDGPVQTSQLNQMLAEARGSGG